MPYMPGAGLSQARGCMPRLPRGHLVEEDSTSHCTWRSHGHAQVPDSDAAREHFLRFLRKCKEKYGIPIHSTASCGRNRM